jgi:hypothetical protein
MAGSKFDPKLFFQQADNVALHVPAAELFGFLKRSLDLPSQWAAMLHRQTGDHTVIRAGGAVEGADIEDVLFVRVTPVEVALEETGIVTRDRYQCTARIRLRISVIPERSELVSFQRKVLGSHRVVQAAGIARYLQPTLRGALAKFAAEREAAELVRAGGCEAIIAALTESLQAPCFAAGLVLDGAPSAQFESGTLQQVQEAQENAARRRAEHAAARQVEQALERAQTKHLDHLTSLLSRLKGMAADSPDVELPELVRTFAERERGELYEALFASEPITTRTHWIVAALGEELVFFDTGILDEPTRRLRVTGQAGSIRSVQTAGGADGGTILLLGAATGVYRWPIDATEPDLTLSVQKAPPVRGGFNAVALAGDRVFASHSELGLCEWESADPASAKSRFESMTRDAKAVRAVQFFDGDLYCAIDDRVICWHADDAADRPTGIYTGSMTTITALCPTADGLFAGNGDGDILHWPKGRDTKPERLHTGLHRAAESVWFLSTNGVRRIVFTDTSLHAHVKVLGDTFSCRYEAGGQTLRRVEVAPDILVATNDLRDRLICWTPGQPATPTAIIGVSRLTGRSIQDVCLVPHV